MNESYIPPKGNPYQSNKGDYEELLKNKRKSDEEKEESKLAQKVTRRFIGIRFGGKNKIIPREQK